MKFKEKNGKSGRTNVDLNSIREESEWAVDAEDLVVHYVTSAETVEAVNSIR